MATKMLRFLLDEHGWSEVAQARYVIPRLEIEEGPRIWALPLPDG